MPYSPYLSQAQYFADDLLDLVTEDEVALAGDLFEQHGYILLRHIPQPDLKQLLVFLGKTPTDQAKQLARLGSPDRELFWLRARHLALSAVDALSTASTVEMAIRGKYRAACRSIAEAMHPHPLLRSKDDLLSLQIR